MIKPDFSDETVKAKTGRDWTEWIKVIDNFGGDKMTHRDIARKLYDEGLVKSGWWCQAVTVGYEKLKNRRVVGETADQGFEVGVHKTLPASSGMVWDLLLSPQGLKIWLGTLPEMKLQKKFAYNTREGTTGEIRTWQDHALLRLTWQPKGRTTPTTLQIRLAEAGPDKTRLAFHHEKLEDGKERETMRSHWRAVADKLEAALTK